MATKNSEMFEIKKDGKYISKKYGIDQDLIKFLLKKEIIILQNERNFKPGQKKYWEHEDLSKLFFYLKLSENKTYQRKKKMIMERLNYILQKLGWGFGDLNYFLVDGEPIYELDYVITGKECVWGNFANLHSEMQIKSAEMNLKKNPGQIWLKEDIAELKFIIKERRKRIKDDFLEKSRDRFKLFLIEENFEGGGRKLIFKIGAKEFESKFRYRDIIRFMTKSHIFDLKRIGNSVQFSNQDLLWLRCIYLLKKHGCSLKEASDQIDRIMDEVMALRIELETCVFRVQNKSLFFSLEGGIVTGKTGSFNLQNCTNFLRSNWRASEVIINNI